MTYAAQLPRNELNDLIIQARSGDRKARNRAVEANMALAHRWAIKFPPPAGYTDEDMRQVAMFGLIRAVEKFEPEKGFKFSTYAVIWIRKYLLQAMRDASFIRLPEDLALSLDSKRRNNLLSDDELAVLVQTRTPLSLSRQFQFQRPISDGRARDEFDHAELTATLAPLFDRLTPDEEAIVLRVADGEKIAAVGRSLGLSETRARRAYRVGMEKMTDAVKTLGIPSPFSD